jgi:mRNA interferase MazF
MRRGEIWTAAGGSGYSGKSRPVVILQDDRFDATASVTVCSFTTDPTGAPLFRLAIEPAAENGLKAPSRLMLDKITNLPRTRLGRHIGRLAAEDTARLGYCRSKLHTSHKDEAEQGPAVEQPGPGDDRIPWFQDPERDDHQMAGDRFGKGAGAEIDRFGGDSDS